VPERCVFRMASVLLIKLFCFAVLLNLHTRLTKSLTVCLFMSSAIKPRSNEFFPLLYSRGSLICRLFYSIVFKHY
jgi:hypothetical protein